VALLKRRSRVDKLQQRGDADGLASVLGRSNLTQTTDGQMVDLSVPDRVAAVNALAELPGPEPLDPLLAALDDPEPDVRRAALLALTARDEPRARTALIDAVGRHNDVRDDMGRSVVIQAVLGLNADVAEPFADRLLSESRRPLDIEEDAALRILFRRLPEGEPRRALGARLAGSLRSHDRPTRERAQEMLALLGVESIDAVTDTLADPLAREAAAVALGRMRSPQSVQPLSAHLDDGDPRVRSACLWALGEIRDPAAIEQLMRATSDPEYEVRTTAMAALDKFGSVAVLAGVAAVIRPLLPSGERDSLPTPAAPAQLPDTPAPQSAPAPQNDTAPRPAERPPQPAERQPSEIVTALKNLLRPS